MTPTMKCISHAVAGLGGSFTADLGPLVKELRDISQALRESTEKPPVEFRMPLPEFHNNVEVRPTPIEFQPPMLENKVYVNPTPIEVKVEPAKVDFKVDTPHVGVEISLTSLVVSVYVLAGVVGASAVGIITSLLLR